MGQILPAPKVKLIAGLLWGQAGSVEAVKTRLSEAFGPMDMQGDPWEFSYTQYYQDELGATVQRNFVAFEKLVPARELAAIKIRTNAIEEEFAVAGKRSVNVDPGYVDSSKMVLATTKDGNYRVYMRDGILGQSTLYFEKNSYHAWPWTYPDYRDERTIAFFNAVRKKFHDQRRQSP